MTDTTTAPGAAERLGRDIDGVLDGLDVRDEPELHAEATACRDMLATALLEPDEAAREGLVEDAQDRFDTAMMVAHRPVVREPAQVLESVATFVLGVSADDSELTMTLPDWSDMLTEVATEFQRVGALLPTQRPSWAAPHQRYIVLREVLMILMRVVRTGVEQFEARGIDMATATLTIDMNHAAMAAMTALESREVGTEVEESIDVFEVDGDGEDEA